MLDDEMIERIVKVLDDNWPDSHKAAALKVIKAMREPTKKMLAIDAPNMPAGGNVKEIWQDMIDAVINER